MIAGLIVSVALCTSAEPPAPNMTEAHRDALAKYGAAIFHLRRERVLSAVKQLEAAAKADPDATEPQKELVRLYTQLGREPEAIRIARKLLTKDSSDYDTAAMLARLLFDAGETKEAIAAAKIALESSTLPDKPAKAVRIYRGLAAQCAKADDFATAETAIRKALELVTDKRADVIAVKAFTPKEADTEAAECFTQLGNILLKRAKFDSSIEAFTSAIKLYGDPKKLNDEASATRLAWNLSSALEAKGELTESLKHLERFLKRQPQRPEPYQRLATLLRAVGRRDEVVSTLQAYAIDDKENYPLVAVLAAEMARDADTRTDADKLFQTLTREIADPVVMAVVVRSHLETRRPIEIIKEIDREFAPLEDREKPLTPEVVAAKRKFASEKARAIADAMANEPRGVDALLLAGSEDIKAGHKRANATYYFLGSLAARYGKLEAARGHFRQAVLGAPADLHADAYEAYISVLWQENKLAEIVEVCREALRDDSLHVSRAFLLYHLSMALAELGRAKEAIDTADRAIKDGPATAQRTLHLRKHRVLCALGQWDEAIEYGNKLLEEFDTPKDRPEVRRSQANAYWGAKKYAEAEKLLRAILDDDPDNAVVCNDLGYHLADQGRNLDEAERLIRHAITVDRIERHKIGSVEPENAAYLDSLGWVLFRKGKLAEAKIELERAANLAGGANDPTVWDHLGDVLFRLGDKAKAKASWEQAQKLYEADAKLSSRGRRDGRLEEVKRKLTRVP